MGLRVSLRHPCSASLLRRYPLPPTNGGQLLDAVTDEGDADGQEEPCVPLASFEASTATQITAPSARTGSAHHHNASDPSTRFTGPTLLRRVGLSGRSTLREKTHGIEYRFRP